MGDKVAFLSDMNPDITHLLTADGSSTLYSPAFGECYHSRHGAVQESMHVFIGMGLTKMVKDTVSIFEMGFGTGLNTLLTLLNKGDRKISYTGIEAFPLPPQITEDLNYTQEIRGDRVGEIFQKIHHADWEQQVEIEEGFNLKKIHGVLEDFNPNDRFDLIYFDAFAPDAQPELWTQEIFEKLYDLSNPGAVFVTYCAKGVVRRGLMAAGFEMERIPGPPGKREMLRGTRR
ncbi:tRNA (5-methylaminomethyl-2-thiouridine)(34)-methyltransferase MnmD [bacterium]|nr:tRNA (5-methylaminomethyl-2-thiouridine)(34)-methyltransferase MnmD [bacterium]